MAAEGSGFGTGQSGVVGGFAALGGRLDSMVLKFASLATAAAGFGASLNAFSQLERQLVLTNSVAGGTVKELKMMTNAVREFSLVMGASAVESASALYFLASAGFSVRESMNALNGVLLLSQATLSNITEVSDIVASTIRAFSLESKDATKVANIFTSAISSSQATLQKLGFALRQVGPVASVAGQSLEDTATQLALLFNVGLRGEQAGTALRNVIIRLVGAGGEAKKILDELEIRTVNSDFKLRNLRDIIEELAAKNPSERLLKKIAGDESLAGLSAMIRSMQQVRKEGDRVITIWDEMRIAVVGNLDGMSETQSAFRIAVDQMTTYAGAMQLARNALTELGVTMGETIAPVVEELAREFVDAVRWFKSWNATLKTLIATVPVFILGAWGVVKVLNGIAAGTRAILALDLVGWFTRAARAQLTFFSGAFGFDKMRDTSGKFTKSTKMGRLAGGALRLTGYAAVITGIVYALKQAYDIFLKSDFEKQRERVNERIKLETDAIENMINLGNFLDATDTLKARIDNATTDLEVAKKAVEIYQKEFDELVKLMPSKKIARLKKGGKLDDPMDIVELESVEGKLKKAKKLLQDQTDQVGEYKNLLIKAEGGFDKLTPEEKETVFKVARDKLELFGKGLDRALTKTISDQKIQLMKLKSKLETDPKLSFEAEMLALADQLRRNQEHDKNTLEDKLEGEYNVPVLGTGKEKVDFLKSFTGNAVIQAIISGENDAEIAAIREEERKAVQEYIKTANFKAVEKTLEFFDKKTTSLELIKKLFDAQKETAKRQTRLAEIQRRELERSTRNVLPNLSLIFMEAVKDSDPSGSRFRENIDFANLEVRLDALRAELQRKVDEVFLIDPGRAKDLQELGSGIIKNIGIELGKGISRENAEFRLNLQEELRVTAKTVYDEVDAIRLELMNRGAIDFDIELAAKVKLSDINNDLAELDARWTKVNNANIASGGLYQEELNAIEKLIDEKTRLLLLEQDIIKTRNFAITQQQIVLANRFKETEANNKYTGTVLQGIKDQISFMKAKAQEFYGLGQQMANRFVDQQADAVGRWLVTFKDGFAGLRDIVASTLRDMAAMMASFATKSIFKNIFGAIVGTNTGGFGKVVLDVLGSAQGNAFVGGSVQAFARGGIIDRPTMFGLKGGLGIAGEVPGSKEGILPLQRDSKGNLGVSSIGSGSIFTYQANMQFNIANDALGRDDTQQANNFKSLAGRLDEQIKVTVQTEIQKMMRPGSLLNKTATSGINL